MDTLTSLRPADALLIITGILFVIQILYYLCRYARILRAARAGRRGRTTYTNQLPPLSVVIYAHEECDALRRNLPAVLGQDYPQFEVIVVNEGDSDGSSDYLSLMETRHANLRHTFVPDSSRYISHKKLALTLGFKAARHDWLVLTDADCRPTGDQWLRTMARNLVPGIQIVLGYSGYERGKGWLHKRAAFDNLFLAMRYLGAALARHPYMGVGRNLLYSKTFFNEQKGFAAHLDLLRGDDDLFINHSANGRNTRVEADPRAIVRLRPVSSARVWREEKIGRAFTAAHYRGMQRWVNGLETGSRLLFHAAWVTTAALAALSGLWLTAGGAVLAFLLRFALQAAVVNGTARSLDEKRRYYLTLPAFDLLQAWQSLRWKLASRLRNKSEFYRR